MAELTAEQVPQGWNEVAKTYELVFEPFTAQFAQEALRIVGVKPVDRVLDVASGTGVLALTAGRLGAEVMATDFSPAMVERLRDRIGAEGLVKVTAEVMDGQELSLPDHAFDAAFSVFGLMFFPDRASGYRELHRVLKPNGRVAIVTWKQMIVGQFMRAAMKAGVPNFSPPAKPPSWQELCDPETLREEIKAGGFREVTIHTVTKIWTVPSAEWLWGQLPATSPALASQLGKVGAEHLDAVSKIFVASLQEEYGEGSMDLPSEALIGIGVR